MLVFVLEENLFVLHCHIVFYLNLMGLTNLIISNGLYIIYKTPILTEGGIVYILLAFHFLFTTLPGIINTLASTISKNNCSKHVIQHINK